MSQGLFTASSGIAANQAKMDVIADNIANIGTVGFKSSQVNFETVFSRQLSAGSPPTGDVGGINPKEIGLGVMVGEIGRNFSNGSIQTTGRTSDLNIQGEGFFTVMNYAGETLLTRAGNFSTDADGNLVNSQGCKVVGTSSVTSSTGGTTTVQIPTKLNLTTPDALGTTVGVGNVGQLDGSTITAGTFTVAVDGGVVGAEDATVTIDDDDTLTDIATKLQVAIRATAEDADDDITVSVVGNNIVIDTSGDSETVTFTGDSADTSNFLSVMGFTGAAATGYTSAELKDQSMVTIADSDTTSDTYSVTSYSISNDGAVEVTYSNGGKLTVVSDAGGTIRELKYTSPSSREISSLNITNSHTSLDPAQLQIQLATVVNPKGLSSEGGNLFSLNAAAGDPTYAIGRAGGLGVINSGSLEASNVDLPSEFSNMILAQRGVEANSRTFSVQNEVLRTIVNLGR
ncbi:MAG: hypothetical protein A2Y25_06685 [Candidatus Melainabacteria bacterium GWF2_37_15]|nr:MAG: hypothetical protein A2Y25_06685 [Candidatus Melainabacteria bacterium GWF2_37_15]